MWDLRWFIPQFECGSEGIWFHVIGCKIKYTNEEYADMWFILGEACDQWLLETRLFQRSVAAFGHKHSEQTVVAEDSILSVVGNNPQISMRGIFSELHMSQPSL